MARNRCVAYRVGQRHAALCSVPMELDQALARLELAPGYTALDVFQRHRAATRRIGVVHAGTREETLLRNLNIAREVALAALEGSHSTELVVVEHKDVQVLPVRAPM